METSTTPLAEIALPVNQRIEDMQADPGIVVDGEIRRRDQPFDSQRTQRRQEWRHVGGANHISLVARLAPDNEGEIGQRQAALRKHRLEFDQPVDVGRFLELAEPGKPHHRRAVGDTQRKVRAPAWRSTTGPTALAHPA